MYRACASYDDALKKFQSVFILTVLREHNGNQSRAAAELGSYFGDRRESGAGYFPAVATSGREAEPG